MFKGGNKQIGYFFGDIKEPSVVISSNQEITIVFDKFIELLIPIAIFSCILIIIFSGFYWIFGQKNGKNIGLVKKFFWAAIVGLILVMLSSKFVFETIYFWK